jgi:hypothetical protein
MWFPRSAPISHGKEASGHRLELTSSRDERRRCLPGFIGLTVGIGVNAERPDVRSHGDRGNEMSNWFN